MAAVIVEELNRLGHVINRHKISQYPTTIGRAFNNDVILEDPYVSPTHVTLVDSEEGCVDLKDNSLNGIVYCDKTITGSSITLKSGEEIVLGRTRLRFYAVDHQVSETRPIKYSIGFVKKWTQPVPLVLCLLVFVFMLLMDVMLSAKQELSFEKGLAELLTPLVFVVIWASVWTFVGRLIKHQSLFWVHVLIMVIFLMVSNVSGWLVGVLEFNLVSEPILDGFQICLLGLLIIWLIANHLRYSTSLFKLTRNLSASAFAISIAGIYYLNTMVSDDKIQFVPSYSTTIKAPYAKIRNDSNIETYLKDIESIYDIKLSDNN